MATSDGLQQSYGLETVSGHFTDVAPEVYHPDPQKEVQHDQQAASPPQRPPDDSYKETVNPPSNRKKILGLSVTAFWIVAGLVILVVIGVGLGAGLGVGLQNRSSSARAASSSATSKSATSSPSAQRTKSAHPSASSTSSAPAPFVTSGDSGIAANSCNSSTPQMYYAPDGTSFTEFCFTDWPNGDAAASGSGNVTDLLAITVYTFEACMQRCLDYNSNLAAGATQCRAVTYNSNLTSIIEFGQQGGDCFLKNTNGVNRAGSVTSACAVIAD